MNVWMFIGSYWWLIFPLGGAVAGVISKFTGVEAREQQRKHEQKLEKLEAERRLEEAKRGVIAAPPPPPPVSTRDQLIDLFATHDEISARWLDYELDVGKLIAFPAMSDGRQPLTGAFLRAKRTADTLRPKRADAEVDAERLGAYRTAVAEYGAAFDIAEADARRVRDAGFEPEERERLDRAAKMLAVATDESATAAERQIAYKRVRAEIDGLIAVSPESISILESKVGREITPGTMGPISPAPDAA